MADAVITITIPDAVAPEVLDALCFKGGYNAETDGTKVAFAKEVIIRYLKQVTIDSRMTAAGNTATAAAEDAATIDLSGVT